MNQFHTLLCAIEILRPVPTQGTCSNVMEVVMATGIVRQCNHLQDLIGHANRYLFRFSYLFVVLLPQIHV